MTRSSVLKTEASPIAASGEQRQCPSCGSLATYEVGALPLMKDYVFAGGPKVTLDPGYLHRCRSCSLRFRHPCPPSEHFDELYKQAPVTAWDYGQRPEWPLIARWLRRYSPSRRILEIGCFRGDFLHWLGDGWERAGIEPSTAARKIAQSRGIKVIASTLEEVSGSDVRYGAVLLLDVLEHFQNPLECLRHVKRLLAPGGVIVVFTGTTDAWRWKISGADYWYCTFPEHLVFVNRRWLDWACDNLGLLPVEYLQLSHAGGGRRSRLIESFKIVAHRAVKGLSRVGLSDEIMSRVPLLCRLKALGTISICNNLRDHILVILQNCEGKDA